MMTKKQRTDFNQWMLNKVKNSPNIVVFSGKPEVAKHARLNFMMMEHMVRRELDLKNIIVWDETQESAESFAKRLKAYTEGR